MFLNWIFVDYTTENRPHDARPTVNVNKQTDEWKRGLDRGIFAVATALPPNIAGIGSITAVRPPSLLRSFIRHTYAATPSPCDQGQAQRQYVST